MSNTKILSLIGFIVLQIGCSEKNQITEPNTSQDKPVDVVVEQKPEVATTKPKILSQSFLRLVFMKLPDEVT